MAIADAIANGGHVAWDEETSGASDEQADAIRGLRGLEGIVQAHRSFDTARQSSPDLTTWAHLTILEKIGEGSFGAVYRAHDARLNIDVALKLLSPVSASRAGLLAEARLLAKVRHPNVVHVYGADDTQRRVGLWMEFVKGRTLEDVLEAQGPFGAREAALVGLDLCRAMAAVHRAGLVHGDIKARNIMREEGGRIVLMDFGAGRDVRDPGAGSIAGTPAYIAPEVLAGRPQNAASDIYALGVLLFHLVTRQYPVQSKARLLLRDARPDLPAEFVRVVEHALGEAPEGRYQSAGAFESALAQFVDPRAHANSVPTRAPARSGVTIAAVLTVAALVAAGIWRLRDTSARPVPVAESAAPTRSSSGAPIPSYDIDAAFHRLTDQGEEVLASGSRLALGDRLFFTLRTSVPTYVYIVDEPDLGQPYLLFPLPGQNPNNPLSANETIRLPGTLSWQVTTSGGREHFVVFVSPERVDAFEREFAGLATPRIGQPAGGVPLSATTAERLRGVGGLVPLSNGTSASARFASLFTTPLGARRETASGLWIRQLTLDNP
jgi:serine/threonine protein kinase